MALGQIRPCDFLLVMWKEAAAGVLMGTALGIIIFVISLFWHGVSSDVALVVAIALPVREPCTSFEARAMLR